MKQQEKTMIIKENGKVYDQNYLVYGTYTKPKIKFLGKKREKMSRDSYEIPENLKI